MTMQNRAVEILTALGLSPASSAASGRYQRSEEFQLGTRYWTTVLERKGLDKFGVQFRGRGAQAAARLDAAFAQRNFVKQSTDPAQVTYCKELPWLPNGAIDLAAVRAVRKEVEAILAGDNGPSTAASSSGPPATGAAFLEFMRNSPLHGVEFDLPSREGKWRDVEL
jgi:hypothetical protein